MFYKKKKITDWITSQKPICRRHPINLNNNITDISQKKDLPKSAKDTKSIAYLCDTNNEISSSELEKYKLPIYIVMLHFAKGNSTLDAPKNFGMTSKTVIQKSIMFS